MNGDADVIDEYKSGTLILLESNLRPALWVQGV